MEKSVDFRRCEYLRIHASSPIGDGAWFDWGHGNRRMPYRFIIAR